MAAVAALSSVITRPARSAARLPACQTNFIYAYVGGGLAVGVHSPPARGSCSCWAVSSVRRAEPVRSL